MPMPNWANGAVEWAKSHKPQAAGIAIGLLVVIFFMFSGGEGPETVDQAQEEDLFSAGALPQDVTTAGALQTMQARMTSLELDIGKQKERDAQLEQLLKDQVAMLSTQMQAQERVYTDQLEAALEQAISLARQTERHAEAEALADLAPPVPTLRILRPGGGAQAAGQPGAVPPPAPAPAPEPGAQGGPWVRLPLGATVTGELLTGAFATKARGDALPVLVQLRSSYSGPNDTEIPLEDCLLIGKATADISSVRARVEAVSLSCVLPDGTAFERQVKGYFTGEDGTLGVPGRWEFRSGRWLANLLSAMGTTAAGLYADVAIAQELGGSNAILGGISTSDVTERIQEFFLERAEEILPVVWVESGTPVYVVMLEGLTIEGLPAEDPYPVASSVWD